MKNIDINQIKHLYYHEKKSMPEIAKILGCSNGTIFNRMKKNGMPRRSYSEAHRIRYNNNIDLSEIIYLYFEKKLTLEAIGTRFSVSDSTIRTRLTEAGYTCRKRKGPRPQFTDAEIAEMVRLYHDEELTPSEIAHQYHCPDSTIRSSLRRIPGFRFRTRKEARALRRKKEADRESVGVGLVPTHPKELVSALPPEQVTPERVLQLYKADGLIIDDIAVICSLSRVDIYNILQETGGIQ